MKKTTSIVLAVALALNIAVSAFASDVGIALSGQSETGIMPLENRELEDEIEDLPGVIEYSDTNIIGGSIYFDTDYRRIVGCDDTVTEMVIPSEINGMAVTAIGENAFKDKKALTKAVIPESVTTIGNLAFANSGITSIYIPKSVTQIYAQAFSYCANLAEITVDSDNSSYYSDNGVLFSGKPDTYSLLICYPMGKTDKSYTVQSNVSDWAAPEVFDNNVYLESVTILNYSGFSGSTRVCPLFNYCTNLKTVCLPLEITGVQGKISGFIGCDQLSDIYYGGCEERWNLICNLSLSHDVNVHFDESDHFIEGVELEIEEGKSVVRFETIKDIGNYCAVVLNNGVLMSYAFSTSSNNTNRTYPAPKSFTLWSNFPESYVVEVYACCMYESNEWSSHLGKYFDSSLYADYLIGRTTFAKEPEFVPGDLNGDGISNISDALELLKYIAHLSNKVVNEKGLDVNGDGVVNINDAIVLLKRIAGLV